MKQLDIDSIKNIFYNVPIKNFFFGTFILGIFIIVTGSFFNYPFLTLILTLLLMSGYFLIGNKMIKDISISKEQFADSNYFLGFLFTLISLSISLLNLAIESNSMDILINQFGIAILTTLLGLFFRIYLINFIPSEQGNEETFHLLVAEKIQLINDQITETIDKNIIFSRVLDEKINMFSDSTKNILNDFSSNLVKNLDINLLKNLIQEITNELNKIYEEQNKNLLNIYESIENNQNKYIFNIKNISDSINTNYKTIENFNVFINEIKSSIELYTNEINKTSDTISKNQISNLEKLDNGLLEINKQIHNVSMNTENLIKELFVFNKSVINTNNTDSETLKLIEKNTNSLHKIIESSNNKIEDRIGELINNDKLVNKNILEDNSEIKLIFQSISKHEKLIIDKMNTIYELMKEKNNEQLVIAINDLNNKILHLSEKNKEVVNENIIENNENEEKNSIFSFRRNN